MLDSFAVREGVRDLGARDRALYLKIVSNLASVVNLNAHPLQNFHRKEKLELEKKVLIEVQDDVRKFDAKLNHFFTQRNKVASRE